MGKKAEEVPYQEEYGKNKDGTYTSDRLIEICEVELKDEAKVLEAHGFDPERWVITAYRHNLWHGMRPKDRGRVILYQSRITARPKRMDDISFKDIERFFEGFDPKKQPAPIKSKQYKLTGSLLEICLADLHEGRMTADPKARGKTEEKVRKIITNIVSRAAGKKLWKVVFVPLGDVFDADTMTRTTSKGTQQYLTGTPYEMFEEGARLMIWAIDQLRAIAPVDYIFIPGNHDQLVSFALAKVVEAHYEGVKNVKVDAGHEEKKWMLWGVNLVAWAHGDMPLSNIHSWLPSKAREEWGRSKYAEVHYGHKHKTKTDEKNGHIVRFLPSPADASLWEEGQGYAGNLSSTTCFVWDSKDGLTDQWFVNV